MMLFKKRRYEGQTSNTIISSNYFYIYLISNCYIQFIYFTFVVIILIECGLMIEECIYFRKIVCWKLDENRNVFGRCMMHDMFDT